MNRLNRLRTAGLVDRHGETRATVYHLTAAGRAKLDANPASQPVAGSGTQAAARLSTAAENLRKVLRRPASERPAVGYQRSFLESY